MSEIREFICVESETPYVDVGVVIKGRLTGDGKCFTLFKDYPDISYTFREGLVMPINGGLWRWEIKPVKKISLW